MLKRFLTFCGVATLLHSAAFASSLHQAVSARDIVTLEALLEAHVGSALNAVIGNGITPLHLAAATDQPDLAALLIARGADVGVTNNAGFTPLHWAASRDGVDTLRVILAAGGDINAKAQNGITPLHWAASKNAVKSVQALIDAGADLTAETAMGYTPLHLAVKQNPSSETAVLLAQASVNQEEKSGILPTDTRVEPPPEPEEVETAGSELSEASEPAAPVQPGMYLSVPIGLGDALGFVWTPETGIWFGKHEITNNRYRRFNANHSSRRTEGLTLDDPDQPVVYVSWQDAADYCVWLNGSFADRIPDGYEFRLPTEAEWMIAAGAGDLRLYPWGNEWPPLYGNFSDQTARSRLSQWRGITGYDDGYAVTAPVENSGMNELGIFGMAGNVWEWTMDWMDAGKQEFKIRKGGSWDFDEQDSLRIAARGFDRPDARYDTIGFRVVVAPKPPAPAPVTKKAERKTKRRQQETE
jgi:formylglycine-generating enzyme required for sulfatase activity